MRKIFIIVLFLIFLSHDAFASFDLCVNGIATESSYVSDRAGARVFENNNTDYYNNAWHFSDACPQWVQYDFGAGKERKIDSYKVYASGNGAAWAPKDWQLQGSNGASNWTTIHTASSETGWANGEGRSFSFSNSTSYRYYRINVLAGNNVNETIIGEIELFSSDYNSRTNDEFTVLLLHSDTSNGSTAFVDSSVGGNGGSGHNIAVEGSVQHSTTQSKFGGSAIYFDGAGGDNLQLDLNHSDFNFGTEPFTIDMWVYPDGAGPGNVGGQWTGGNTNELFLYQSGGTVWNLYQGSTSHFTFEVTASAWNHLAIVGDGSTIRVAVNGVFDSDSCSQWDIIYNYTNGFSIGSYYSGTYTFNGYMDEYRVSKGVARWSVDFTPPLSIYAEASGGEEPGGGSGNKRVEFYSGKTFTVTTGKRFEMRQ